jgi:hypothetical protein
MSIGKPTDSNFNPVGVTGPSALACHTVGNLTPTPRLGLFLNPE